MRKDFFRYVLLAAIVAVVMISGQKVFAADCSPEQWSDANSWCQETSGVNAVDCMDFGGQAPAVLCDRQPSVVVGPLNRPTIKEAPTKK